MSGSIVRVGLVLKNRQCASSGASVRGRTAVYMNMMMSVCETCRGCASQLVANVCATEQLYTCTRVWGRKTPVRVPGDLRCACWHAGPFLFLALGDFRTRVVSSGLSCSSSFSDSVGAHSPISYIRWAGRVAARGAAAQPGAGAAER
eukprot:7382352-Prymnesium_polylepis.4